MTKQNNSTNNYACANFIVSPTSGNGNYTTIASAISAASSGSTIFIKPGTYTENLTLKAGVNLTGFECDSSWGTDPGAAFPVKIVGKLTCTYSGSVTISGVCLQTNSDYVIESTGTNVSRLQVVNCYLNGTNNSIFHCTNAFANFHFTNCSGDLGTTGIAPIVMTNGTVAFWYTYFTNSGSSTTASTVSGGNLSYEYCSLQSPTTTSSTGGLQLIYTEINTTGVACLTIGGSGTNALDSCIFVSNTASALSIGGYATVYSCEVNSSNTNAITGAGTIVYAGINFTGASSTINTTTQTPSPWPVKQGGTGASGFTPYSVLCGGPTTTGSLQNVSGLGSSGNILTSNGASALPSWQAPAASSITITGDSGGGLTGASFTFTGGTTGLTFSGATSTETLGGTLAIANGGTDATSFTQSNGIVTYNGTRLVNYAGPQLNSSGVYTNSAQPAFQSYISGNKTNVTGDGTTYRIAYDTNTFDQASNVTTGASYAFTAPVTGIYQFSGTISISNLTSSHTDMLIQVVTTLNTNLQVLRVNPGAAIDGTSNNYSFSVCTNMTASNTAYVQITVSGSTKTVTVDGGSFATIFAGFKAA